MSTPQSQGKSTTKNMTEGPPMRLILGFSVPLLFGFLLQQLYNVVDMIVVGRFIGVGALAGVGGTGSINFLIIGLCIGLCSGFCIPVAQKFGAGDYVMMRRFIANSVWLSLAFAAVITVVTAILCDDILTLMKTPDDIFHHSYNYIFVIFCGIPTVFLFNLLAGFMRALGDSKTPLNILIVSSILHIVLDVAFVVGLNMGVEGVAFATVISQFVSGILCWIALVRKFPILKMTKEEWRWQTPLAATLCAMGIPMGLQYSVTAIGGVILQSAVNSLGSDAVAAVSAAVKVIVLFACPFDTLGNAMATYGGQNVGAGRLERLDLGLVACAKVSVVYSILAMALLWIFGRDLAALFIDRAEAAILDGSALYLRVCSSFYITLAAVNVYRFLIQGMGFGFLSIFAGVAELFARAFAGIVLVPAFGFTGACFAGPLAWIFADIFLIPAYHHCKKKLKMQIGVT